jgi:hypothetical protein
MQGITVLSVVIAYEVVRRIEAKRQASELRRDDGEASPALGGAAGEVAPA